MDYLIRAARITDIDRLVALSDDAVSTDRGPGSVPGPVVSPDLLRQLVYLPQASVLIAEEGRDMVGGAVLALRPSVRAGGYIGTVELLAVDPRRDVDRFTAALLEELLRSARNKGCTIVEAASPDDSIERDRWERLGFAGAGPLIERAVAPIRATASR